ncbi:hypothetical protein ACFWTE_05240 [Nocardiopsis sp. NPDC058631]|uniref:hypothetical protein n=1 Tax=Nocardiopsis sp. NPDC058631 TaxID=3346566 RepID=UPI0036674894
MSDDPANTTESAFQPHQQGPRFQPAILLNLGIAVIGLISMILLLATPSTRFQDAENPVDCRPVAEWGLTPGDTDFDSDRPGEVIRDSCDRNRQDRLATAVIIAVPTAIAGSVGMTALVFRRQLSGPKAKEPEPEG